MAVKVAGVTSRIEIVTSVCVLPLHDMRVFAGRAIVAEILCEGRLILGIGRGAFAFEMARLGVPIETSREKFDESLDVLLALFTGEEVSWRGKHYNFDPLTIMPRPVRMPQIMLAALVPEAIHASVKRGFHIQTTPLSGSYDDMKKQIDAFHRGKAELGEAGRHLRLALSRVCVVAGNAADARRKLALANDYYSRFDNVYTGPGLVSHGRIEPLPRRQSLDELAKNLIICPVDEMIDRLGPYGELGIDEFIMNVNVGHSQAEALEAVQRFAEDVMPHVGAVPARRIA